MKAAQSRRFGLGFASSLVAILVTAGGIAAGGIGVFACSTTDDTGTIAIVSGESDVLSAAPAVAKIDVQLVTTDDAGSVSSTDLGSNTLPTATNASTSGSSFNLSLADVPSSAGGAITLTGSDAMGIARIKGTTLQVTVGAIGGITLDVFVQRLGQMSRLPGALSTSHTAPTMAIGLEQYVAVADPGSTTVEMYDLLAWGPTSSITLTEPVTTLASVGTLLIAISATSATYVDLYESTSGTLTAPAGGSFADVAGGSVVNAPDGTTFVVGGTRTTGAATPRVLVLSSDGTGNFAQLATARLGASAAYAAGRGLVVAGGSATGAGVEVLPTTAVASDGSTTAVGLAFPSDSTTGAGAAALNGNSLVLAGGSGSPRLLDLACSVTCAATPWMALPTALPTAQAFPLDSASALVVGDDALGITHAVVVNATSSTETAFRVPRQHARALPLPTQGIAIAGGATSIESYLPAAASSN